MTFHPFRATSLTARLGRAFGAIAALVVVASAAVVFWEVRHQEQMAFERSEALARGLARAAARLDEQAGRPDVPFDDPRPLQTLVEDLRRAGQGDIVIVDRDKRIVADSIPANVGGRFEHDASNEVGLTLADGRPRRFAGTGANSPQGARQVVVRLATPGGATQGALILDYAPYWEATVTEVRLRMLGYAALGLLVLGAAVAATFLVGRGLLAPIGNLAAGAEALTRGEAVAVPTAGRDDELDRLAAAFNGMAASLTALMRRKDEDTARVAALAGELETRNRELAASMARLERQNREVVLRNEMADLLHSCLDLAEAGAVIARYVPRLFPAAAGAVYRHNSGSGQLAAVARWGAAQMPAAVDMTDCWALRRGKTHLVTAGGEALPCAHAARPPDGSALCVPLAAHGETLGLLHLTCAGTCGDGAAALPAQLELIEALAAQIGMALANLKLRENLREQAIRDALTGLYNRRYLDESLQRELARAAREEQSLAVFMLDVDHFKQFNDHHGHEAGDAVLRALGGVLREASRAGDLPCRFGGEEFAVVLPGAALAAAREWGERLMQRVRALEVIIGGTALPGITVSLGLAVFPGHGGDGETLLQAADLALYDAKQAGRDRLAVSGEAA